MSRHSARGPKWEALRKQVIGEETHCHRCGQPVLRALPGTHPLGPTVDHLIPRSKGGPKYDRSNLRLAHRRCNLTAGDREPEHSRPTTSRQW